MGTLTVNRTIILSLNGISLSSQIDWITYEFFYVEQYQTNQDYYYELSIVFTWTMVTNPRHATKGDIAVVTISPWCRHFRECSLALCLCLAFKEGAVNTGSLLLSTNRYMGSDSGKWNLSSCSSGNLCPIRLFFRVTEEAGDDALTEAERLVDLYPCNRMLQRAA